ncbi:MAG: hypothetical protein ACPW60_15175 [Methylohalobius sp. ZOD2]|nr:hypothetical protein [Methylothermaceae bacterium]
MLGGLGGLIAIAVAIWFYRTAVDINDPKSPFVWAFNGAAAYYVVVLLWWFLVLKPVSANFHHTNQSLILAAHVGGYVLALALVWFIRNRWIASMKKSS